MSAFAWFLTAWLAFDTFMAVATAGQPRKPFEPLAAAILVAINVGIVTWLLIDQGVLG